MYTEEFRKEFKMHVDYQLYRQLNPLEILNSIRTRTPIPKKIAITKECIRLTCKNKFETTSYGRKFCSEQCRIREEKLRWYRKQKKNSMITGVAHAAEILKNKKPLVIVSGVYFLYLDDTLQYIGSSKDVHVRVEQWKRKPNSGRREIIPYNRVEYVKLNEDVMREYERIFVFQFKPPYNSKLVNV